MKWTQLSARNFGPLSDWKVDIDTPVTIFLGHNEAGKSTMMELMCALLFGQRRRKEDVNAFISWGHSQASLEGELTRDGGSTAHVTRVYQNGTVTGTLTEAGASTPLGSEPIPWIAPMNRELYRDVFALSLSDLLFPGQDAWSESQDQLLTGQFGQELRPAQEVSQELYKEAMALWRPDRRGKTRMEALDEEIAVTAAQLEEAKARENRRRALQEEALSLQSQLSQLQQEETRLQEESEHLTQLAEPVARMRRALEMEQEAGGLLPEQVPADPETLLSNARQDRRRLTESIGETGRRLAETHIRLDRVGEDEQTLLRHAQELEALSQRVEQEAPQAAESVRLAREARDSYLKNHLLARHETPPAGDLHHDLDQLAQCAAQSQSELAYCQIRYQKQYREFFTGLTPLMLVLGILGLMGGFLVCPRFPVITMATSWSRCYSLGGAGLLLLLLAWPVRCILRHRSTRAAARELAEAEVMAKVQDEALREALGNMKLSSVNDNLSLLIPHCMEAARLDSALQEANRALAGDSPASRQLYEECVQLCRLLPVDADANPKESVLTQAARLDDIRLWQREEPLLREQLQQLKTTLDHDKLALQQAQDRERNILELLAPLSGRSEAEKLQALRIRANRARQAQALRASLQGQNLPDPEHYQKDCAENVRLLQENAQALRQVNRALGVNQQGLAELSQQKSVEPLQEQFDALQVQQKEMAFQRDRLAAMSALVDMARVRYQQENQGEIIRRASSYLSRITSGRYSRMMITDDRKGVRIYSSEAGGFLDPAKDRLSRGTKEQVYMSLRLGLIDHLDPSGETLPLILDETFVNWDQDRLERGIGLFKELSRQRQVFAFTCHDWMAQTMISSGCDAKIVRLS